MLDSISKNNRLYSNLTIKQILLLHFILNTQFRAFSLQHLLPILIVFIIGYVVIKIGRSLEEYKQRILGVVISMIPLAAVIIRVLSRMQDGTFTIVEDLPLHLCRTIAIMAPIVMWTKNRFWLGIFYFWIGIGTAAANIIPDLKEGFPDVGYFAYWMLHSVLIILPFYAIFVYQIKIDFKDLIKAYFATLVYTLICWGVNIAIGSNYSYTMVKPPTGGLLDILGPYPLHIATMQILIFTLFLLLYIPFWKRPLKSVKLS